MARIIQGTSSAGFGGLEMVIHDFHAWLIENGHDAKVVVREGTALYKYLVDAGFENSMIVQSKDASARSLRKMIDQDLDSKETAFLFHRHRALKMLTFRRLKGKTSMLSHTFYKAKKRDFWHRYLFSKIDRWIALTPLHQQNMSEMLGLASDRITTIPNGVNLNKFKPALNKSEQNKNHFHIGIVARLDPQKGQDIAIEALACLKKATTKKLFLHFFGDETPGEPSIRPQLKALVEKLNLESEVIFEGFKPHVETELAQMDLLWLPSHRETFGRCVIEAMACGVPVVGSNAGGVPDIIEHKVNGMLFETKNSQDLMTQTLFLIENPTEYKNIREQALKDVRAQYDIDQIFSRLLHAILPDHVRGQNAKSVPTKKKEFKAQDMLSSEASFTAHS